MSTPPVAHAHDGERRKSLGKYVKRMSSVFKREKASKPASAVEQPQEQPQREALQVEMSREDAATRDAAQEPAKADSSKQEHPTATPAAASAAADDLTLTPTTSVHAPIPPPTEPTPPPVQSTPASDRRAMQQERARALFAKYGLTLESHEWFAASAPAPLVPRVEKPIRMRVHRSCHLCGTLYGHDKVCVQCEHRRCKSCPRYPKKKTPGDKARDHEAVEQPKKKKLFTVTTRHGTELAYHPATQRVRRTCHKCHTLFVPPTATTCESCKHVRCTKCPREPAKRNKWPTGYPGDVAADSDDDDLEAEKTLEQFRRIWRKPRRIVRWECEQCHSLFRQGSPQCPGCAHERCDQCTRSPVKKPKQEESFDPAVVAAVEAKLRALGVDDDPPTSDPEHV